MFTTACFSSMHWNTVELIEQHKLICELYLNLFILEISIFQKMKDHFGIFLLR